MSKTSKASEENSKPISRVMQAGEVKSPDIHKWQFVDLASDAKKQLESVRADVLEKIKQEIQPKLAKQTAILKREAYEEAKQQGYEEGYLAGFETGQTVGIERAEQQALETLKPKVERLEAAFNSLRHPYSLISSDIYQQLVTVAMKLAERITEEAVTIDKQKVLHFIEQAVQLLPDDQAEIEVELNPEDLELVRFYQAESSKGWVIKANSKLQVGECRVKKLNSIVHHQWRARLDELLLETEALVLAKTSALKLDNDVDSFTHPDPSHSSNSEV
ncbi:hypothetical protein JX580_08385 [Thiomicrospira microaerophila]|uniref:FliH/SctL family protein n=1 Tax=Thiomicrospira microaerophila TaxID=406020 RepID=UPI00200F0BA8|nr:FliH/SctL family protein [Thiomicrospira microaerophila]UQB41686.1 hypothetical protein JX580_08385 [Thiomicrospira microaerophila]